MQWEEIGVGEFRTKIPGGWLVKVYEDVVHDRSDGGMDSGWDFRVALAYVPDPNYEWGILVDQ